MKFDWNYKLPEGKTLNKYLCDALGALLFCSQTEAILAQSLLHPRYFVEDERTLLRDIATGFFSQYCHKVLTFAAQAYISGTHKNHDL